MESAFWRALIPTGDDSRSAGGFCGALMEFRPCFNCGVADSRLTS